MNTAQIQARLPQAPLPRADFATEAPFLDDDPEWNEFLALGLAAAADDLPPGSEWQGRPVMLSY